MRTKRNMLPEFGSRTPALYVAAVSVACIVVAAVLRGLIDPVVDGVPFITFFPAVAVAAFLGGAAAGLATMLAGAIVAAYFWVPPLRSFALDVDAWITVALYAVLSSSLIFLIWKLHETVRRAKAAEETARLYAREMVHRTANLVTLVKAVANLTFKNDGCPEEQRRTFDARLVALGRALAGPMSPDGNQDVLSMVRGVLLPFGDRVCVTGRSVGVTPEAAARLSLIFHELGTNAAKYGALSVPEGRVNVAGSLEGGMLAIDWWERGGPPVDPHPRRRGFGSRLLKSSLSRSSGYVELTFEPTGLSARIVLNRSQLADLDAAE